MNPSIQLVKTAYNQYSGTGKILALFFLSLFVLFFMENEKEKRSMFLYPSFLLLLFALEPVWKGLFAQMGNLAFNRKVYFLLHVFLVIGHAGRTHCHQWKRCMESIFLKLLGKWDENAFGAERGDGLDFGP